ncbi:enoyl-CoA hydratase/isomerase family protein [Streptomyces sp. Y7]|uniref:enoyl-CoA hydratase/isomerase family protein n=1 Tax=Streptomyces sp. Y7 TaxID=3342392 RepID=UPI003718AC99
MSTEQKLIVEKSGPVTTLTLNRPQVHNALDRDLSQQLNEAVREIRDDVECRVVVFQGAGNTFCAGDDVSEFSDWPDESIGRQIRLYQETAKIIEDLTQVTIAKVDGIAVGGGLELTLVCDFVVATDRSRWGMPEIDWDITPGWGGTNRLAWFAGRRKTKEWNLIGALFNAETAERYDLINRLTTPEQLDAEVESLIEVMLAKEPRVVERTKKYLKYGADNIDFGLALESEWIGRALTEGVRDFRDRDKREQRRKLSKTFWQN